MYKIDIKCMQIIERDNSGSEEVFELILFFNLLNYCFIWTAFYRENLARIKYLITVIDL